MHDAEDLYKPMLGQWSRHTGNDASYVMSGGVWIGVRDLINADTSVLECGCGVSTWLIQTRQPARHVALECSPHYWRQCVSSPYIQNAEVLLCELAAPVAAEASPWYAWTPDMSYDVVLIDGPAGDIGRDGVIEHIHALTHDGSVIIVDDTQRADELTLAGRIAIGFNTSAHRVTLDDTSNGIRKKFSIIERGTA